jgi:hypothetical protein
MRIRFFFNTPRNGSRKTTRSRVVLVVGAEAGTKRERVVLRHFDPFHGLLSFLSARHTASG